MNKKNYIIGGVVVLAVVLVIALLMGKNSGSPSIVSATMSKSMDLKDQATVFDSKNDKVIYEILSLSNVKKTTKVSYVRYLNDKYIDSKVTVPSADGVSTLYFSFEKGIGNYPAGQYKIVNYIDGKKSISTTYSFK